MNFIIRTLAMGSFNKKITLNFVLLYNARLHFQHVNATSRLISVLLKITKIEGTLFRRCFKTPRLNKGVNMKKLLVMLFVLSSNLTFASYHGGGESDSSGGGGGYGGGSSAAGALVGVGLIAYFVMNRGDEEEGTEFVDQNNFKKFQIDFSKEENNLNSFSENDFYQNDFQVNFKYYLN